MIFGVLTPLSAIFQLYPDDQFLVVEEAGVQLVEIKSLFLKLLAL
jgi:hypothetical protein